jgi:TraB/PrgY/gumN family
MRLRIFLWALCSSFNAYAQAETIFAIKNGDGVHRGIILGVFHNGLQPTKQLIQFLASESNFYNGLVLEQNPVGGWSPELANAVLKIHSVSTSELIKNEQLKCMALAEKPTSNQGKGYAALFSSGPAGYLLMNIKPRLTNVPTYFSSHVLTTERWLLDSFKKRNKTIEFLEEHIDPFKLLKEFSAKQLGEIAEKHCHYIQAGVLDKKDSMLDVSSLIKNYEAGDFDQLRAAHKKAFLAAGWSDELINNQYEKRERIFAKKISDKLKTNNAYIFTVGAAHIGGDTGLLALLRKEGFQIAKCDLKNTEVCK